MPWTGSAQQDEGQRPAVEATGELTDADLEQASGGKGIPILDY